VPKQGAASHILVIYLMMVSSPLNEIGIAPQHSKDDGAVFTYAERKENKHGSRRLRLGNESIRSFDCCCLGLVPPRHPVVTSDGFLYDKQALLENLWSQRISIKARRIREARSAVQAARSDAARDTDQSASDARAFLCFQDGVGVHSTSSLVPLVRPLTHEDASSPKSETQFDLSVVVKAPEKPSMLERPHCPMSNKPLRMKDLRAVRFTPNTDTGGSASETRLKGRLMCPVCYTTLRNTSRPAVLPSGNVICHACVLKFLQDDMLDPVTGEQVNLEKDVIFIRSGGTAFAFSGGESKEAKQYLPSPT
jgi:nitric oxide synthase-interacting protein